jgi:hypothetical protein
MMKMYFNLDKSRANINLEKPKLNNYFNKNMNYYICSSGGCGSTILSNYLSKFGNVYHIHDRYPPEKLCYIGKVNTDEDIYKEWFNKTEIPEDKLHLYKVIFIYRNPIQVIFSRCVKPNGPHVEHLQHIKCDNDGMIGLGDIINTGKDLYGLEEFFDNYTIPTNRNYKIYAIKYELFFSNITLFNKVLDIPDIKSLYPIKSERNKHLSYLNELNVIYHKLIMKMNSMPFIKVIPPTSDNNLIDNNV